MAEAAAAAGATPLLPGIPDEIAIWEILVRLPPKSLLRCRAVCPTWRRATSTRHFLLAHHHRQPALPLLYGYNFIGDDVESLDVIPFNHQAGVAAADQLQSVARLAQPTPRLDACFLLEACCDGLLVLSALYPPNFSICNPATRDFAPLPQLYGFTLLGMYPNPPTGESEYRLLLYQASTNLAQGGSYVYELGSGQPPRHIGCPDAKKLIHSPVSLLFRGSLHWCTTNQIMVFDTTTESFRQICSPIVPAGDTELFEMGGMLAMSCLNDERTTLDIWVMPKYEAEVWAFKNHVELPIGEIRLQSGNCDYWNVVVTSWDGDVLVQVQIDDWLLQVNIDGKLVSSIHRRGLSPTEHRLTQSLVRHTFFPTLEGYVVNASPFI
ncbi:unnamed protein product [Triticum turgidum subsp. durum]|uniref:F-box domain-containing protein n=1 Tax=Triticum turgidum subsp. durum TaxID=4567 RepID=A0A9R1S8T5_TRITD|nr:unnamed protein product [Triticum turgidum subsp. durum]